MTTIFTAAAAEIRTVLALDLVQAMQNIRYLFIRSIYYEQGSILQLAGYV